MRPAHIKKDTVEYHALRLLYDLGYDNCTMRKIAETSAISHASIYKHFRSKNELASMFIQRYIDKLLLLCIQYMEYNHFERSGSQLLIYWFAFIDNLVHDNKFFRFYQEFYYNDTKAFISTVEAYSEKIVISLQSTYQKDSNLLVNLDLHLIATCLLDLCTFCRNGDMSFTQCVVSFLHYYYKITDLSCSLTDTEIVLLLSNDYLYSDKCNKINIEKDIIEKEKFPNT